MAFFGKNNDAKFQMIFEEHLTNTKHCAPIVVCIFEGNLDSKTARSRVQELEHEGDRLTGEAYTLLAKTFITSLDKEDIEKLVSALDDIIDSMKVAVILKDEYELGVLESAVNLTKIISEMLEELVPLVFNLGQRGVKKLTSESIAKTMVILKQLEERADVVRYSALGNLSKSPSINAKNMLKWKNILDELEKVTDHEKRIANIISSIVLKRGD